MVAIFGGEVRYWCLAIESSLRGFRRREEIDRRGRRQRAWGRLGPVLRFEKTVTLHFRILADVMFLARTDDEQGDTARDEPGAEQSGTHSDATVVVKVSAVQLKVRVFPAGVGIQLKAAPGGLLSATWVAQ